MATKNPPPLPFTRIPHPDPTTNRVFNDVYDKLQQVQKALSDLQASKQPKT